MADRKASKLMHVLEFRSGQGSLPVGQRDCET